MHKVAILDAGAQYGKVIDRRVRELGIYSDLVPLDAPDEVLNQYDAFIISGGPGSVHTQSLPYNPRVFDGDKPVLGICYGMQLMNVHFGGTVAKGSRREDCETEIVIDPKHPLFTGLAAKQQVLMSHGDSIRTMSDDFTQIASSGNIPAAISHLHKPLFGTQFHPEVDLTPKGKHMLKQFLFETAHLTPSFTLEYHLDEIIEEIRNTVSGRQVISLVSGGVDSTVATALLGNALPEGVVHALHIDNGLMRENESEQVKESLRKFGVDVTIVRAQQEFFTGTTMVNGTMTRALKETIEPELKRKIIGDTFIKITEREIKRLGLDADNTLLVQGTLRPDLIESASQLASSSADVIKTHHNDTALVRKKREKGLIIEPNKDLHKDEVRRIGELLGIQKELVWRHPFPGPGLAVRILCAEKGVVPEKDVERLVNSFTTPNISSFVLPIRSVGVQGDGRTYSHVVALSGQATWSALKQLANEIPKVVHKVNRVVYVWGPRINKADRITPTYCDEENASLLRRADEMVNHALVNNQCYDAVAQMPVILTPVSFGKTGARSIVLRPFKTNDFMTGTPVLPDQGIPAGVFERMVADILTLPGISRVMLDLTSKPPGTTEWE